MASGGRRLSQPKERVKMKFIVTILILLMASTAAANEPTYSGPQNTYAPITYQEVFEQAYNNCPYRRPDRVEPAILWQLIEVEKQYNVPTELRGMILAAACKESGYNPNAKGDRKFSRDGKTPMAIGILQMWKIYEKMYPGIDRTDPEDAAHGWMHHIKKQVPKVIRMCKYRKPVNVWVAAWVTGIRSKKAGGRCKERPTHLRLLKKWHRNIKADRKRNTPAVEEDSLTPKMNKGDGC